MKLLNLSNCNIVDVMSGTIRNNCSILIDTLGSKIIDIIPAQDLPEESEMFTVDCSHRWAIPGLIDLHVHLCEEPDPILATTFNFQEPIESTIVRAQKNLSTAIRAGITTVRDLGSYEGRSLIVRDLGSKSFFPSPTVLSAGQAITWPKGHWHSRCVEAKGEVELRKKVNQQIDKGADLIKVMHEPEGFNYQELSSIIEETHCLGKKVACHAYKRQCVEEAIYAGADTIEHAGQLSSSIIHNAVKQGTVLVPTLICALKSFTSPRLSLLEESDLDWYKKWINILKFGLIELFQSPVLLGTGTDAGFPPIYFDDVISEIEMFVSYGLKEIDAIRSATVVPAKAIDFENSHGDIAIGKIADIVILGANPLNNIHNLRDVKLVLKSGCIIVDNQSAR